MAERVRIAALLMLGTTLVSCSDARSNSGPGGPAVVTTADGCDGDALAVAKTFVGAVEAGNSGVYEKCQPPGTLLAAERLGPIAAGGWLLDSAVVADDVNPPPAANAVVIRVPAPDQPADTIVVGDSIVRRPPHVTGLYITATLEGDGKYSVTSVVLYGSS